MKPKKKLQLIKKNELFFLLLIVILFSILVMSSKSWATTYYVDATNGKNSNYGTSPDAPWKTIAKVNISSFNPGDNILFKRGEIWREQLVPCSGDDIGYVRYGAYGTGNKPLILGSIKKNDISDWTHEEGNIWIVSSSMIPGRELLANRSFDIDANMWSLYSEGGASVIGKRDIEKYNTYPASYKIVCKSGGTKPNHIQFFTVNLSITEGHYYKLAFRAKSTIDFSISHISLIKTNSPWSEYASYTSRPTMAVTSDWNTYEIIFRSRVTATDGRITIYFGGVLPAGSIFYIDSLSFKRCPDIIEVDVGNIIFNNEEFCGVKVWDKKDLNEQGEFWYDEDNSLLMIYSHGNPASNYSDIECALRRNIIQIWNKSHIIIENLDLRYGGAHGIQVSNAHHIIVKDCDLLYIGGGDLYGDSATVRYGNGIEFWENAHDCSVERCRLWEIYDAALTNQGFKTNSQYNLYYRYNIIRNSEYSFEYWNKPETSITHDIYIENNTFINAGGGWSHSQRNDPSGRHLCLRSTEAYTYNFYIRNNIFFESTGNALFVRQWVVNKSFPANLVLDFNRYYQSSGDMVIWQHDNYTMAKFSDYQTEKGKDLHSILSKPKFKNSENHTFKLSPSFPCTFAGKDVRLSQDYDRQATQEGSVVEIPAFEYPNPNSKPKDLRDVFAPKY